MKSSGKYRIIAVVELALSVIGIAGIFVTALIFRSAHSEESQYMTDVSVGVDDYNLFFKVSVVAMCAVVVLLLISVALRIAQGETGSIVTTVIPFVFMVFFMLATLFYMYLVKNDRTDIATYILMTGIFETLIFLLPRSIINFRRSVGGSNEKQ